ncbi:MAG: UDP-N-acetylmuramoyl-L-alanine--D-glutamate ligase [Spirochaetota bacterium]
MNITEKEISSTKVTVMGLGLHGGGTTAARFFASLGAQVTVTDLKTEEMLAPSLEQLKDYTIRYVLGKHEASDFSEADLVIKNPAVPGSSPFLKLSRQVETDLSIFLNLSSRPVIAVTGSKGKSTTATAIYEVLKSEYPGTNLGGNITVSPLNFLQTGSFRELRIHTKRELTVYTLGGHKPVESPIPQHDPVILEVSSWQLADLRNKDVLKPVIAIITNILPDHQDRYRNLDEYADDKRIIFANQGHGDFTICNYDDEYGRSFANETKARVFYFSKKRLPETLEGGWLEDEIGYVRRGTETISILPDALIVPGEHNKINLLSAGVALYLLGLKQECILAGFKNFKGLEHRLEKVRKKKGVTFFNDSAATIPQATVSAVLSLACPIHLIIGGTDKNLDFSVLKAVLKLPKCIYLLDGTAAEKIRRVLQAENIHYTGSFNALVEAVTVAYANAEPGEAVLFSPGCASFGMFLNEFDRGKKFKEIVNALG